MDLLHMKHYQLNADDYLTAATRSTSDSIYIHALRSFLVKNQTAAMDLSGPHHAAIHKPAPMQMPVASPRLDARAIVLEVPISDPRNASPVISTPHLCPVCSLGIGTSG
eukprot:6200867-Pleurochrysis_carterae.AAC.4